MQNSRCVRLTFLMLLSVALTACDQMITQLDQFMKIDKQSDCESANDCHVDMTQSDDMNWFLKEVRQH